MSWGKKHYARFEGEEEDDEDAHQDAGQGALEASEPAGTPRSVDASPSSVNGHAPAVSHGSPSRSPSDLSPETIGVTMDEDEEAAVEAVSSPLPVDPAVEGITSPEKLKKPVEVVKERRLSSNGRTFINSLTCFIGSATYTLPACFQNIGLVGGSVMLALSAVISLHCMFLLVDCRNYLENVQNKRIKTYGDIGYYTFDVVGARLVDTFIMLTQFGFCVCYVIVVSETVSQMFPEVSKRLCIYMMIPLLVRASWLKSLRSLAKVSLFAETGMFISLALVMFYIVHRLAYGAWDAAVDAAVAPMSKKAAAASEALGMATGQAAPLVMFNMLGVSNFFGVSICVFEGVGMVLPVYNSMKHPESFKPIWGGTLLLVTGIYLSFGVFGYMAYRPDIDDIILANLPHIPLTIAVKICFCVGLYLTYPLMLFPVIEIWEEMAGRRTDADAGESAGGLRQTIGWNVARSLLVIFTGILAMFIPKLTLFVALIGASGSTMLAFVLPTSFTLKLRWGDMTLLEKLREAACFVIGVAGGSVSTLQAVKDLRDAYFDEVAAGGL